MYNAPPCPPRPRQGVADHTSPLPPTREGQATEISSTLEILITAAKFSSTLENTYICTRISSTLDMIESIRKYNFWDERPIDLGYPRAFYTEKIGQYIDNQLIKVLVGQRRAGKS